MQNKKKKEERCLIKLQRIKSVAAAVDYEAISHNLRT